MVAYTPNRGDIIYTNFNPQTGREQSGRRPALVLSTKKINKTGLALVCPITTQTKNIHLEVPLPKDIKTKGVVLPFHAKMIDIRVRGAIFVEQCPTNVPNIASHFINKIQGL